VSREEKKLDLYSEEYVNRIMSSQFRLSVRLFFVFILVLLGLPVLNLAIPRIMNLRVAGFTLTWFFLAVLIYPVTWLISWIYVRSSINLEREAVSWTDPEDN